MGLSVKDSADRKQLHVFSLYRLPHMQFLSIAKQKVKVTYDSGSCSLALLGSVSPISDLQPSTAPSRDNTMKYVGPLKHQFLQFNHHFLYFPVK